MNIELLCQVTNTLQYHFLMGGQYPPINIYCACCKDNIIAVVKGWITDGEGYQIPIIEITEREE